MPFKVDTSKVEYQEPVPPGIYEVRLTGFKPQKSSGGGSINLNPQYEITNHAEYSGRKIYDQLNSAGAFIWPDFCHAFGLPMETDGESSWIPGEWNGDVAKYKEEEPSTWVYRGPLTGRVAKMELGVVDNTKGRDINKIRRYFCIIQDCAQKFPKIKHQEDLLKNQAPTQQKAPF